MNYPENMQWQAITADPAEGAVAEIDSEIAALHEAVQKAFADATRSLALHIDPASLEHAAQCLKEVVGECVYGAAKKAVYQLDGGMGNVWARYDVDTHGEKIDVTKFWKRGGENAN